STEDTRMDQYDKLKTELMKKEWEWEDIENQQRKAQKELQEHYENVEETTRILTRMLEEKYQEVLFELRQVGDETGDLHQLLNNGMSEWHTAIDQERYSSIHRLDQKQEDLDTYYKNQYRKMQDQIDEIYTKYRE
ncbi:TPA: hypothetical protein ACGO39_002243, partial [Streptococcus suis]